MIAGFSPDFCFIVFCYKYIVVVLSLLANDFNIELNIKYLLVWPSVITFNI